MIRIEIQMYFADHFATVMDKQEFENQLKNVELGNTLFVKILDEKGKTIFFNPKHVAYIRYLGEKS